MATRNKKSVEALKSGGPTGNRTRNSAMRMLRNTVLLWALICHGQEFQISNFKHSSVGVERIALSISWSRTKRHSY